MIGLMNWDLAIWLLPGLLVGLTVHEFAHAWVASLLGDDFPRRNGRVSLNPLRHLSPLGTLAIFFLPIGWGKPVMVNLHNFRHPKRDYLLSSLAGPAANLLLAGLMIVLMLFTRHMDLFGPAVAPLVGLAHYALTFGAIINIALAILNLLPIPPLDGSKIWICLIPGVRPNMGKRANTISVVVLLVLLSTGALGWIVGPAVGLALSVLPQADYDYQEALCREYEQALKEGNYGHAEQLAGELLEEHGPSPHGYYCRAHARGMKQDWPGALEDLNSAIALAPDAVESASYYRWRADILDYLGKPGQAATDRAKALELAPSLDLDAPESQPSAVPTTRERP